MEKEKRMGHVYARIGVAPEKETDFRYYTGLVDTGATLTVLPSRVAREAGIDKGKAERVMAANGMITLYAGRAELRIGDKSIPASVWISDEMEEVVIGVTTLELLGLGVAPKKERLIKKQLIFYSVLASAATR